MVFWVIRRKAGAELLLLMSFGKVTEDVYIFLVLPLGAENDTFVLTVIPNLFLLNRLLGHSLVSGNWAEANYFTFILS
jgi:hypothetical protein